MRNATLAPVAVKSAVVLFSPAVARRLQNPAFGLGLYPARERRVGYTAADAQWWAENSPANQDGPSDAEWDRMAEEAYATDLLCRGIVLA